MWDLFGIKRRRAERHDRFLSELPMQTDEYLFTAWSDMDMSSILGTGSQYTAKELRAVESELERRGYTNDYGQVVPKKGARFAEA